MASRIAANDITQPKPHGVTHVQVNCQQKDFTYDHVYGGGAQDAGKLYSQCVLPLVGGLFKGYNATVFAYGAPCSGALHRDTCGACSVCFGLQHASSC